MSESCRVNKGGVQATARGKQDTRLTVNAIRAHYHYVAGRLSAADSVSASDRGNAGERTDDREKRGRHEDTLQSTAQAQQGSPCESTRAGFHVLRSPHLSTWASMFLVIDGPDGTGKTTLVKALRERLARLPSVVVKETREPYTPWLREWLSDPTVQARELLVAFAHDRDLHLREVVEPALARGEVVLCDRYIYSTVAYQTLHNPPELVRGLVEGVRKPDLCVVLTCPLDTAMARIVARGLPPDRYDHKRDIQAKVAAAYKECAAADDFAVTVDAGGTPEETLDDAWGVVLPALYASGLITREIASRFADGHGKPCERLDYSKAPKGYALHGDHEWSVIGTTHWGINGTDAESEMHNGCSRAWAHYKRHNDPPLPHHPWRNNSADSPLHHFRYAFVTPEGATILETRRRPEYEARRAAWHWYDLNVIGLKLPDAVPDYTSKRRAGLTGGAFIGGEEGLTLGGKVSK